MSAFHRAVNTTINGGNLIAVSNTVTQIGSQIGIISVLLSRSATAGLLDAAERFDAPKCDEGTRVSMLRKMTNFVQDGDRSKIFWLHGPAGVGKSALAQSLALSLKDESDHAASFFFSRTAPGRNDGNQLIVTLAYQLAVNFPALQTLISEAVDKDPAVLMASNTVKMQRLIVDPINRWQRNYKKSMRRWAHRIFSVDKKLHPRLILVDGLDECHDAEVQRDLLNCIGLAVQQLLVPIRFVVASRPESHILATFEHDPIFQRVDVLRMNLGDDEDADGQITTFLLKEFAEIRRTHPIRDFLPARWPLPDQIGQLVLKSSKGFIYPTTVIRYIKMPNNRPDECLERILGLSEIPISDKPYEPLDNLYRYIFESVPDANKETVRNIFHFLLIPTTGHDEDFADLITVTPDLIEECCSYKPGHVQHVLRDLLCVVDLSYDGSIKVLHASLPDFLLDRSRSGHLCIDGRDVAAAITASFASILRSNRVHQLPARRFGLLKCILQADISPVHRKLADVDLQMRYKEVRASWSWYTRTVQENSQGLVYPVYPVSNSHLQDVTFVAAYLVLLLIKNALLQDIEKHIAEIKTYILQTSPFAASIYAARQEVFPLMTPVFHKWVLFSGYSTSYIFAFEVPPEQHEIREEISRLYFLMLAPFLDSTTGTKCLPCINDQQPHAHQPTNFSNQISLTLLGYLVSDRDPIEPTQELDSLACELLSVFLAQAAYEVPLTNLLKKLCKNVGHFKGDWIRIIAPIILNYTKRTLSEAPGQQDVLELDKAWRLYLNPHRLIIGVVEET